MRTRIIYDPGEPVVVREYPIEALAILGQSILESADIPSMIRFDRAGEITQRTFLLVRREHLKEAQEVLNAPRPLPDDDAEEGLEP
jgi:hypothetical protein